MSTTPSSSSSSSSVGFCGLLTVLFIALKLCGVISWSWVWVLSPLWIGTAVVLLIVAIFAVAALIGALFASRK